jgi:hypothetical protein
MSTKNNDQKHEHEEQGPTIDCCSPQKFADMMARFGADTKSDCSTMIKEMMKNGCCQPEKK